MPAETATRQLLCVLGQTRFPAHQTLHWRSLGQICHDCFRRSGATPATIPDGRTRAASLAKASSSEA